MPPQEQFHNNSIFWVEVEKISSNPFQPRKDFNEEKLNELANSIRQYGVLQPLVVTRKEIALEDGGIRSEYEIIAGERRLRASKIAGLPLIPVIIRSGEDDDKTKLEIAIIENLQREDLNPIDRAKAFNRLAKEFNFKHVDIAKKVGKSRVYVSNTMRLLNLSNNVQQAISDGRVPEGHARSILMLEGKPEEQETLFKEIVYKKITARDAENIARNIAKERRRKKDTEEDPQISELAGRLSDNLGTRVQIEKGRVGGKIVIDYFSEEDLEAIINSLQSKNNSQSMLEKFIEKKRQLENNRENEEKETFEKGIDTNQREENIENDQIQKEEEEKNNENVESEEMSYNKENNEENSNFEIIEEFISAEDPNVIEKEDEKTFQNDNDNNNDNKNEKDNINDGSDEMDELKENNEEQNEITENENSNKNEEEDEELKEGVKEDVLYNRKKYFNVDDAENSKTILEDIEDGGVEMDLEKDESSNRQMQYENQEKKEETDEKEEEDGGDIYSVRNFHI